MAVVNKTRTYVTGNILTATYYNEDRDEIIAGVNSIVDAQVAVGAGIQEGKLTFADGGHGHTGGTDGKKISMSSSLDLTGLSPDKLIKVNSAGTALESTDNPAVQTRGYMFYVGTDLTVSNDVSANPVVVIDSDALEIYAYVKTPSLGQDIIAAVKTAGGTTIASITIPAGSNYASATLSYALTKGTYLRLDVTQIGTTQAGSKLTVVLNTTSS